MRKRITRALAAAAAAGVTLATFGLGTAAASASVIGHKPHARHVKQIKPRKPVLGAPIYNTSAAGYEASGRNFRYIQALITVPDITHFRRFFPEEYIQLSNGSLNNVGLPSGDQFVRAGIMPCHLAWGLFHRIRGISSVPCSTGWVAFVETFNNSLFRQFHFQFQKLDVNPGDGVFFSIYFDQAGNELHFKIVPPTPETCAGNSQATTACYYKTGAKGPIFNHAAALDDFVNTMTGQPIPLPPFFHRFKINQFFQGAITTLNGRHGSFVGPWRTSPVVATSNGAPFPLGHVRVSPGRLFSDGMVANGAVRPFDAFSVFARS